ncbi:hypothetical protein [Desulfohalobium retbaense]|uniref:Uncharacterized protein n=1 Tax=Desulfohalobium retbaense (strain ATCC 49708 / DSM 5692 / JCM 16813 / HR100) TaxID=485915 RepID=C8X2T5_DESRD|nr:hypothetical protein [Desulfohalobium retbaense]ACV68732.1 hypothetical protein Dret_1445 [Desulfohalobium retbaense DSM 5692]
MLNALKDCVGETFLQAQITVLRQLGPKAGKQRTAVLLASLLRSAQENCRGEEGAAGEIAELLDLVVDDPSVLVEESHESELLFDLVDAICREAGLMAFAESDDEEGLAEMALTEFVAWARGIDV